ncbi:hypothetical protein [Spirosoma pollinicola]|uniref:Uncharacterized protein n=1 Tax=Spirosoma pollinicola TaxID=2057025 RepID=A0A2K8ZBZ8_9BACT|nr:hypothetical protein [Spirosoma pollinicola]AUD07359.1 hypothetical protein CWM47_17890 [Spirosoma pollinicola]
MKTRQIVVGVNRVWDIDGYSTYFFDAKGAFYRFNARGEVIPLKRTMKRYTQGYVLKSRFFSLSQLRPMLRWHNRDEPAKNHPADF